MANLVEQIIAQSKAGSAEGESLPVIQAFTAGSNLKTEEVRRRALEQSISFNDKMDALKLTEAQLNMQRIQETTAASGELASYMLDASSSPDGFSNPEVVGKVKSLLLRHPTLIGTPIGTQALGQITAAARLHQLIPGGQTGIDGTKFEPHINAKGEVSYVPVKSSKELALIDAYQSAVKSGDTERAELIKNQLDLKENLQSERFQNQLDMLQFKIEHGGGYTPGQMQKDVDFIDSLEASGKINKEQASNARSIRMGLAEKASAAGHAIDRQETGALIKRREKLMEAQIEKEAELDKLKSKTGMITGTSKSTLEAKQREVDLLKSKVDEVNRQIQSFRSVPITPAPNPTTPLAPSTGITKPLFEWDDKTGQLVPIHPLGTQP